MGPHAKTPISGAGKPDNVRDVLDSLRRIVRELRLSSSTAERRSGVTAAQLFVLQVVGEKPGASVNDVAEQTNTDQSSVSVVVRRLAAARLLARKTSPDDARRVELRLTPKGRRVIEKQPEPMQVKLFAALDRLKPAELRALTRGLGAVIREMNLDGAPPTMFFEEDSRAPK